MKQHEEAIGSSEADTAKLLAKKLRRFKTTGALDDDPVAEKATGKRVLDHHDDDDDDANEVEADKANKRMKRAAQQLKDA